MTNSEKTAIKNKAQLRVNIAATLLYLAYRLLGATRQHAWDRARMDVANAIIDKTIETVGMIDPRQKGKPGIQAFFEGGSINGETRFVDECGAVSVTQKWPEPGDNRCHVYRRTERMRGQQVVFAYHGLIIPPERATALDAFDKFGATA